MSVSLHDQLRTLLLCLAMGLGVGLLYDLLRQVRLALPWRWAGGALDLLFWAGAWSCLFFCGIVLGGGRVRLYIALCLMLGAAVYFWLASPWVRRSLAAGWRLLVRLAGGVLRPVRWVIHALTAPLAKYFRQRREKWKKFFSFSVVWSKIYHPRTRSPVKVRRGNQEREASPHVSLQ